MSTGVFALAGAFLGVLGTVLVYVLNARLENRKESRRLLRETSVSFITDIMRARQLSMALYDRGPYPDGPPEAIWTEVNNTLGEAQAGYERLRLIAESVAIQEAARWVVHHAYWLSRAAGEGRAVWKEEHDGLMERLVDLFREARRELGLKNPDALYTKRGLPVPPLASNPNPSP